MPDNSNNNVKPHPITFTDAKEHKKSTFTELFDTPIKTAERIIELEQTIATLQSDNSDQAKIIRSLESDVKELRAEVSKLQYMVDNGLGDEDMIDDNKPPQEI